MPAQKLGCGCLKLESNAVSSPRASRPHADRITGDSLLGVILPFPCTVSSLSLRGNQQKLLLFLSLASSYILYHVRLEAKALKQHILKCVSSQSFHFISQSYFQFSLIIKKFQSFHFQPQTMQCEVIHIAAPGRISACKLASLFAIDRCNLLQGRENLKGGFNFLILK